VLLVRATPRRGSQTEVRDVRSTGAPDGARSEPMPEPALDETRKVADGGVTDGMRTETPSFGDAAAPGDAAAVTHFKRGKKLVEEHVGDSASATKEILEEGVKELNEALGLGYADRRTVNNLIGDAHRSIALTHLRGPSDEQQIHIRLSAEAYHRNVELDPTDVEARLNYAEMSMDDDERFRQYQESVRLAPKNGMARYLLGNALRDRGEAEAGLRELKQAVKLFTPGELQDYGFQVAETFREEGLQQEAEKLDALIKARPRE